jgi:hypothetical protein
MIVEKQMECRLAGETEVLAENLPQRHFVHHKSHMSRLGFEPGAPLWEACDYYYFYLFIIWFVTLLTLRPLLAYRASLG